MTLRQEIGLKSSMQEGFSTFSTNAILVAFIQRLKKVDVKPSGPGALLSEMENKGPETHFYLPRNLRT
jgi:hypothetical protein